MLPSYQGVVQHGHIRLPAGTPMPDGMRVLVTFLPPVDEAQARRAATRWLVDNVGDAVMADQATLACSTGGRQVWRFGAFITASSHDPWGPIGYVDVDLDTGAVLTDVTAVEEMIRRSER